MQRHQKHQDTEIKQALCRDNNITKNNMNTEIKPALCRDTKNMRTEKLKDTEIKQEYKHYAETP